MSHEMNTLLTRHQQLSDQSKANVVLVQVAHRSLKRYFNGELQDLDHLNPAVTNWLETHGYIEPVLAETGDLSYETTRKAHRAMHVAA